MEGLNASRGIQNKPNAPAPTVVKNDPVSQVAAKTLQKENQAAGKPFKAAVSEAKSQIKVVGFTVSVNKKTLDDLAIKEGYGYKTANLMVLEQELSKINPQLKNAEVRVPPFMGINDSTMQDYLNNSIPELIPLWTAFLESFDPTEKEKFLSDHTHSSINISQKGMAIINQIQEKIGAHFASHDFKNDKLADWFKNNPTSHLMVRSTGKEDTDESSNAGGNESVASVLPNDRSISEALSKVVSSYFGAKSITQRLTLGDTSVFTEPKPFVPVLFQVMVGEEPGNIPRSGVMFTSEHHRSPGVTMIQTGLGHNEGVVNSQVEVDSYLADREGHVHSVVRQKKTRIKDGQEVPNDAKLQNMPALSQDAVQNMKTTADHLQNLYQKPLDIEYTVKKEGPKDIIYLLQTRPLKRPESTPKPSYIDFDRFGSRVITGTVLPSSDTKVLYMDQKEQVIFADNIVKALDIYNDPKTDRSKVKAVIINKQAGPSSHPAVFLHAKELPIFMIDNKADYRELIKAKEWTLDVQQGLIIPGKYAPELVCEGYISYPIPRELTVDMPPIAKARLIAAKETDPAKKARLEQYIQKELAKLNSEVPALIKALSNGQPLPPVQTIRGLLRQLALKDTNEAKLSLAVLVDYFSKNVAAGIKNAAPGREDAQFAKWMAYERMITLIKNEVLPAIEKHPPQSLERLYPLKFLEALILQSPSSSVVGGFSFGLTALTEKKETASLQEAQKLNPSVQLTPSQYIALNSRTAIYRQDVQEKWVKYVSSLSETEAQALVNHLQEIQKLGFLNDWMNIRFPVSDAPLKELRQELEQNKEFFNNLGNMVDQANRLEKNVDEWSDPNYPKKHSQEFMKTMLAAFDKLETDYSQLGWMGKMAVLGVQTKLIDIYDLTIKAVTGSTKYPSNEQKLSAFQELLTGYRAILVRIAGEGQAPGSGSYSTAARYANLNAFLDYIDAVRSDSEKKILIKPDPFTVRPGFDVDTLTLNYQGNATTAIYLPYTEEEFFTVYHQNLINAINLKKAKLGMNENVLPEQLQKTLSNINLGIHSRKGTLSYIGTEGDKLNIVYNIPLGSHSGTYKILYNHTHPELGFDLIFKVNGLDWGGRFAWVACAGALLAGSGNFNSAEEPVSFGSHGGTFSIKVPPQTEQQSNELFNKLDFVLGISFNQPNFTLLVKGLGLNFRSIKEEAFKDSLFWNHKIMKASAAENDWQTVASVAKQTLIGLANRGWDEYINPDAIYFDDEEYEPGENPAIESLIGNFDSLPGNESGRASINSLTLEAALYLVRCLQNKGDAEVAARQSIKELEAHPAIKALPRVKRMVDALKQAAL